MLYFGRVFCLGALCYYVAVNLLLLLMFAYDKRQAQGKRCRVAEKNLLLLGVAGGMCGGMVGMRLFRHKTRKRYFALCYATALLLHLTLIYLLIRHVFAL